MGIDHVSRLIVGFELDADKIKEFMKKHDVEDSSDMDMFNIICPYIVFPNSPVSLYVVCAGNSYEGDNSYYLCFFKRSATVGSIKCITSEHLDLAKKFYKEIMDEELECDDINDIKIYSVNYTS